LAQAGVFAKEGAIRHTVTNSRSLRLCEKRASGTKSRPTQVFGEFAAPVNRIAMKPLGFGWVGDKNVLLRIIIKLVLW